MPFTLSHPAAVLPFVRRPFSAAALVAGALTVSLPYALALYGFLRAARRPVGVLLPAVVRPGAGGSGAWLARAGWVLVSLVLGIATHLVWDSFTHGDGYVVTHVPPLSTTVVGDLTWARLLQHVSTVAGLAIIGIYLWRRRDRLPGRVGSPGTRRTTRQGLRAVGGVAVAAAVVGTLRWWSAGSSSDDAGLTPRDVVEGVLSDVATGAGATLIGGLLLYVAGWWVVRGARTGARG